MHQYAQDAMTYVRHYGTADLFITFTCNPQWIEIRQELFPGITARVFKQKLKSLMDFIVKYGVRDELLDVFSRVAKTRIATRTYSHLVKREKKDQMK